MRTTIFDQFLAGSELASALIYLGLGCLIGWNVLGVLFMLRSLITRKVSAMFPAILTFLLLSALAALAIGVLAFLLVSRDPRVSIMDFLLLSGPAILVPIYCWRIERAKNKGNNKQ